MDVTNSDGWGAYGWETAMATDDGPTGLNIEHYQLPDADVDDPVRPSHGRRLIEGDRFFNVEDRYTIEITDVRTKIYQGVVGGKGSRGGDAVFFTTDHNPPRDRGGMFREPYNPHLDKEPFCMGVQTFANKIATGDLIPHTGNGVELPP